MAKAYAAIVEHIRQLASAGIVGGVGDQELLRRYVHARDKTAFGVLLRRHGPMVWNTARRILAQAADADDAMQAVFLVLARDAKSLLKHPSLAGWLHETTCRIAKRAKTRAVRRSRHEGQVPARPPADALTEITGRELLGLLDDELRRMPDKHRTPLVLCYLEGRTQDESARQMGCSVSTFKRRLERGRELLRSRLVHRGVTFPAAFLTTALTEKNAVAAVPATTVTAIVEAAMALTAGNALPSTVPASVVGLMRAAGSWLIAGKLKICTLLLVVLCITGGIVRVWITEVPAAKQPNGRRAQGRIEDAIASEPTKQEVKKPATDLYGDPLPPGALVRVGSARLRHGDKVWAVAFAPDGHTLVSGSGSFDPTLRFWNLTKGREIRRLQTSSVKRSASLWGDGITSIAFSPDGSILATGTEASSGGPARILLWNARSGERLASFSGHKGQINSVAFSPDGKLLASGGYDKSVRLWDVAAKKEVRKLESEQVTYSVCFSPNGKILVSAGADSMIHLWDVTSGKKLRTFEGGAGSIHSVTFDRAGQTFASAGKDRIIRLWDLGTGKEVRTLTGHKGVIGCVAFSPDDALVASASRDRTVRLWNRHTGEEVCTLPSPSLDFYSVTFSADSKKLAAGALDNGICVWDVAARKELLPLKGSRGSVARLQYSPDGAVLASNAADGTVRLSDPLTGKERSLLAKQGEVDGLGFSSDGHTLFVANGRASFAFSTTAPGKVPSKWEANKEKINGLASTADGKILATASPDGTIRLWNATTGELLHKIPVGWKGTGLAVGLAISPDGKVLALRRDLDDVTISLHDAATGRQLHSLRGHTNVITGLSFLPDGATLLSGSVDRTIRIWDVATGKELRQLEVPKTYTPGFESVVISADGRFAAAGCQDRLVRLWEVATGQEVRAFSGHQGIVLTVSFAPDLKTLASGGIDGTILVWDVSGRGMEDYPRSSAFGAREAEAAWADLASPESPRGGRALWTLVAAANEGVAVVRKRLHPVPVIEAQKVAQLIADLGNNQFAVRNAATVELKRLGEAAKPALTLALAGQPPLEMHRRVEKLLAQLEGPERLRAIRALAALERIATRDAVQVLEKLAGGAADAALTRDARASLERLTRR